MKAVPREGIVLTKICGMYLLVPTRKASEHCKVIVPLSIFELMCWEGISKDKTVEELYTITEKAFRRKPEDARRLIDSAVDSLASRGCLIRQPDGEDL